MLKVKVWFAAALLIPSAAFGQEVGELTPETELKDGSDPEKQGWDGLFGVSGSFALAHNSNVVGQVDGFSFLGGGQLRGGLDYRLGSHEWMTTLAINLAYARTPPLNHPIKTNDLTGLESMYNYYFLKWLAAFVRVNFETPLLATQDIQAENTNYQQINRDGGNGPLVRDTRFTLANPFQPLTMNQSAGINSRLLNIAPAVITVRAGIGGRETLSRGVFVVDDNDTTPDLLEVQELDNVLQFGAEIAAGIRGKFKEQRISYGVDLAVLFPFVTNDAQDRGVGELTRVALVGILSFKTFEWLSLDYQVKILRDKQLIEELQVQNNVVLTFNYNFVDRYEPPKAPPPVDPKLQEAIDKLNLEQKRAEAAEEKAKLAEEKAKAAEEKADAAQERLKLLEEQKKEEEKKEEEKKEEEKTDAPPPAAPPPAAPPPAAPPPPAPAPPPPAAPPPAPPPPQ